VVVHRLRGCVRARNDRHRSNGEKEPVSDLTITQLVAQARVDHPCSQGHDWQTDGGRACPHVGTDEDCGRSQAVYRCARCGEWDYGYPGGPGHADCVTYCATDRGS
jgi:hypothetical protein